MSLDDSKDDKRSSKAKIDKRTKKSTPTAARKTTKPKTPPKKTSTFVKKTMAPKTSDFEHAHMLKTPQVTNKPGGSIGKIFGFLFAATTIVFVSVLTTIVLIPLIMGVNPLSFYRGELWKNTSNKTIIKTGKNQSAVTATAEKVTPSVVTISIFKKQKTSFFFPEPDSQKAQPAGTGSGVIYRKDGYIVTNNHVIEGADKVVVTFQNSKKYAAKVIAGDSDADLAILKINKTNLEAIELGSTKDISVGDIAVAIGTPFDFQHTVTSGIISAKNREFEIADFESQTSKTLTNLIQTDAAINPGNSGGALVDINGKLIGINTAIASSSRSSAGIGFAIPVERVKNIANSLIKNGRAIYPYIGVQPIDSEKVADKDLPRGIFLLGVVSGGPAEKSGLKSGDVITKINNKKVTTANAFISTIKSFDVGTKIEIAYIREGATINTAVTVAEKPNKLFR